MNDTFLTKAIEIARINGHIPGHVFSNNFTFCLKCNACLTYNAVDKRGYFMGGTYSVSCK